MRERVVGAIRAALGGGLKWVSEPTYSVFDVLSIALVAIAWHDHNWFAMGVFAIMGALTSNALKRLAKRLLARPHGASGVRRPPDQ